ncbi:MAG: PEGA domain-containing protein [Vicinamibacterales bacterium]
MDSQDRLSPGFADEAATHASLQLELRVPQRQMIAAFRETFLRWLNDRSGPFARLSGRPEGLSLDEVPDGNDPNGHSTLRLSVSWSFAAQPMARSPLALPPPTDQFVFFPDPPQTGAPVFTELSVPLQAHQVPSRQLRLQPALSEALLRSAERGVEAARGLAESAPRRLGLAGLTIRSPLAARTTGVWGAALFGAAAVAVGFTAGSIYLANTSRASRLTAPPAAAELRLPVEPIAAPLAMVQAPPMPLGESLPQIDTRRQPVDVLAGQRLPHVLPPTSSALGLADAEITTRPPRPAPAKPVADRRPGPVVVRAAEVVGTSGAARSRIKGTLLVKSDPQGAEVSINGVAHGRTPLLIRDLGAGSRVVRLDLPGYERWSWAVAVVANRRTPVTVKLQPEVRGAGQE